LSVAEFKLSLNKQHRITGLSYTPSRSDTTSI